MNNTSNTVPGQSQGDPTVNTPTNVVTSDPNVGQNSPSLEELQAQLAAERAKNAKFEDEAFKAREKERKRKEQELADKTALETKLKEQGEFKTLADQLAAEKLQLEQEIAQRDAEIAKRDHEALRAKVATKHGLAPELAMRLSGQTEDELNADAAMLKKIVGEQVQQARQPGNSPGPKPAQPTDEQRRQTMVNSQRATGHYPSF